MPTATRRREAKLVAVARVERTVVPAESIQNGTTYVGLEHVDSDGTVTAVTVQSGDLRSGKFAFTDRHVLYGKLRPYLRKVARPGLSGVCSTDILPILPGPDLDRDFLFHYLRQPSVVSLATARSDGVNLPRVSPKALLEFPIALPPLAEQRRIAAVLDKADGIRRKRRESLRLLGEFLRSAFLEMFGDPVRNENRWETRPLGEVADVERGKFTPRPRNDPQFYDGPYPFIQTGDIAQSDGVVRRWRQTLNERGATVSRQFPAGTIALAIAANIADTAIVEFDFYCPDSVVGIAPNKKVTYSEYLETCLRFFKPVLAARAPMTAQRNINLQALRPLRVPVPPLEVQARFGACRVSAQSLADRMRSHAEGLDALFDSLAQRAFRGEL